jgi:UDP-N-acetyl-D-galactosamine dehydrogenase
MVVTNQSSQLPQKKELMFTSSVRIGVIGLGYVGLPLAVAFAHRYPVIGFDINTRRIADLQQAVDETGEVDAASIAINMFCRNVSNGQFLYCNSSYSGR